MKATLLPVLLLVAGAVQAADAQEAAYNVVPLQQQGAGAYYARVAFSPDVEASLLVDTGSSYVVLTTSTFNALKQSGPMRRLRKITAAMAGGRPVKAQVYEVPTLVIGESCELQAVEVVVLPGATRNILGLSALRRTGSFSMTFDPPTLLLGDCDSEPATALASR